MSNALRKHARRHHGPGLDPLDLASIAGTITDAQHENKTTIPDAHHAKAHGLDHVDHPDVEITAPADGEVLTYESATAKWKNKPAPAAPIAYQSVEGTYHTDWQAGTTFVDMPEMSITVAEAGTYLCLFSGVLRCLNRYGTTVPTGGKVRFMKNTTALYGACASDAYVPPNTSYYTHLSLMTVQTLAKGDVIKVQWAVLYTYANHFVRSEVGDLGHRSLFILKVA